MGEARLTEGEDIDARVIELAVVLVELREAGFECVVIVRVGLVLGLRFPERREGLNRGDDLMNRRGTRRRTALVELIGVLGLYQYAVCGVSAQLCRGVPRESPHKAALAPSSPQ